MSLPPPRKRFGQHFLHDENILDKILSALHPKKTDHLVEIGPGQGALTERLVNTCQQLDLIEIDRDLVAHLKKQYADQPHVRVHQCDVLKFDFAELKTNATPLRVIGNLPYNISSPLLFHLFTQQQLMADMHFMLQKEVALRLSATVNDHHYNRLSVMSQYFCDNTTLFNVPASAFSPPPQVLSAFIRMLPRHEPQPVARSMDRFAAVVKEAFTYRRKTISNALKRMISSDDLVALGIDPKTRPQALTRDDYIKISNHIA